MYTLQKGELSLRKQDLKPSFPIFWFFETEYLCSLCSPGCLGTHSVDQAGLELRDPPVSGVLGLKACTTTALHFFVKHTVSMLPLQLENKSFLKFSAAGCGNTREAEAG